MSNVFYDKMNDILVKMKLKPMSYDELHFINDALDRFLPNRSSSKEQALDDLRAIMCWMHAEYVFGFEISPSFEEALRIWALARASKNSFIPTKTLKYEIYSYEQGLLFFLTFNIKKFDIAFEVV